MLNEAHIPAVQLPPVMPMARSRSARTIGFSVLGRPILVEHFGDPDAPLRVFFLAGQHGDERAVRRSLRQFLASLGVEGALLGEKVQVAALELANPDGDALGTRNNAQGIDINRDHFLLHASETNAIHRFVGNWHPHLIVDMHNYPSRRLGLVSRNLRMAADICLDFPTNPAVRLKAGHPLMESLANRLKERLSGEGFHCDRYTLVEKDGSARHGTPQLVDARNTLALRYGTPVVLLEARNPSALHGPRDARNLRKATVTACAEVLLWAAEQTEVLLGRRGARMKSNRVPLRFARRRSGVPLELPVVDLATGEAGTVPMAPYRPTVKGRRRVELPYAYAVPASETALLALLARHGFHGVAPEADRRYLVEESASRHTRKQTIDGACQEDRPCAVCYEQRLQGFLLFRTERATGEQICGTGLEYSQGAAMLALMLEAESAFGVQKISGMLAAPAEGNIFPIRRVMEDCGPVGCQFSTEVIL